VTPVKINSHTYKNCTSAEAQTPDSPCRKGTNQLFANKWQTSSIPVHGVSATEKINEEQTTPRSPTHNNPEISSPVFGFVLETGEGANERATAKAFVSFCSSDMLVARVLIAGELQEAHLDSCASHCFVSVAMSAHLTTRGYPPIVAPVCFEVKQGNPLCDTNLVHFAPLSIVLESGAVCTWDNCLFLVADAGAPKSCVTLCSAWEES
jgi:hypothetical protein